MTTKEKIAQVALDMFSVRGYEAVSIRDIAGAVGIKESSIYNHYKNKQAIFDALVEANEQREREIFGPLHLTDSPGSELMEMDFLRSPELLSQFTADVFLQYITEEGLRKFRQMLVIEQFRSPKARRVYLNVFVEQPIAFQTALFGKLMEVGIFHPGDPAAAAAQFYAPIFLLFSRYGGGEVDADKAREYIRAHVVQFGRVYERGGTRSE